MINFNWKIVSLPSYAQVSGETDVVFEVNWECVAKEVSGGIVSYTATSAGTVPVQYEAGTPFTPYNQLTQDQVWGWINPSIDRSEVESNLAAMIDAQKNPTVVTPPLPWSNNA